MTEETKTEEAPWPPTRVWLPTGSAELAAVSPELQDVEGAWWIREDSVRSVSPDTAEVEADDVEFMRATYAAFNGNCMEMNEANLTRALGIALQIIDGSK